MKRKYLVTLSILLAACLCLSGCGKSEETQAVDDLLATLTEITLDSGDTIVEMEQAVAALEPRQQKKLDNLPVLEAGRAAYDALVEERDMGLITNVETLIAAIGTVDTSSESAIKKARTAYDELPEPLKARVTNANILPDAESALFAAQVKDVEDAISKIGVVDDFSKNKIDAAVSVYHKYSDDVRAAVSNYTVLTDAQNAYAQLQANKVITLIDQIGTVTLDSGSAIEKAQSAYNGLTATEKKLVTNQATLSSANTTFTKLQKEERERVGKAALATIKETHDKIQNITWYESKSQPQYINTRSYILPYFSKQYNDYWLHLFINYTGDDWVFFKKVSIWVDGTTYTKTFSYYDVTRDNDHGDVWEYVYFSPSADEIEMLHKIAASKETVVRFTGDSGYKEFTVKSSDKTAIKNILAAYDYLKNS